jgi:LAO/AO transport system kinase
VRSRDPETLLAAARAGDRTALGRLISVVERGGSPARQAAQAVFPLAGQLRRVIGITGAPGAGKSTLTDQLVALVRGDGRRVGVLAIDPSSPFSGGALLGDRVRMQRHSTDDGVFIRSMATRGHLGGLALATPEVVRVMAAVGLDMVIIETVGVGQVEVEVASNADTTVVVVNPGWGDAVQANKAGLLEIADVFVVNKADRPGAAQTRRDLAAMLDMNVAMGQWRPPIVLATATEGKGMDELWAALGDHYDYLERSGELGARRARRLRRELAEVLVRRMERDVRALAEGRRWDQVSAEVTAGRIDPYEAAEFLRAELGDRHGPKPEGQAEGQA